MVTCPRCGRSNEGKYRFCLGCGASLNPDARLSSGYVSPPTVPSPVPSAPSHTPALRSSLHPVPPPVTNPAVLRPSSLTPPHRTTQSTDLHAADRGRNLGASDGRVEGRLAAPPPAEYQDLLSSTTEPLPGGLSEPPTPQPLRPNRASTVSELETGTVRRVPRPVTGTLHRPVTGTIQQPSAIMQPTPRVATGPVHPPGHVTGIAPQRHLTPIAAPTHSGVPVSRPTVPSPQALGPVGQMPPPPRSITVNPRIAPSTSAGHISAPAAHAPANVVQVNAARAPSGSPATGLVCERCGTPVPPSHSFCGACGTPNVRHATATSSSFVTGTRAERIGMLALIDDNGQESQQFPLYVGENRIGAGDDCQLRFGDDGFLAELHCAIDAAPGRVVLRPIDSANGTYLRITTPIEIHHGDFMRVGQEVLCFERLERMTPEHGRHGDQEVVGWPVPRGVWGRLCQIGLQRQIANAYLLANPDVFLGRERGDILFPKDGFVSGSHAVLSDRNGRAFLKDLGSSNGTFVRVKQDTPLRAGDLFLLGRNLLRVRLGN